MNTQYMYDFKITPNINNARVCKQKYHFGSQSSSFIIFAYSNSCFDLFES